MKFRGTYIMILVESLEHKSTLYDGMVRHYFKIQNTKDLIRLINQIIDKKIRIIYEIE